MVAVCSRCTLGSQRPPDRYLVAYYLEAMDLGQGPLLEPAISLLLSIRHGYFIRTTFGSLVTPDA